MKNPALSYITLTGLVIILLVSSCEFTAAIVEPETTLPGTDSPTSFALTEPEPSQIPGTTSYTIELPPVPTSANPQTIATNQASEPTITIPSVATPSVTFIPSPDTTTAQPPTSIIATPSISTIITGSTSLIPNPPITTMPPPGPSFSEVTVAPPINTYPYDAVPKSVIAEIFSYEG